MLLGLVSAALGDRVGGGAKRKKKEHQRPPCTAHSKEGTAEELEAYAETIDARIRELDLPTQPQF